jgi:hypothetical protein
MNIEETTYANGRLQNTSAAWNRHCGGKSLYNMRLVQHAL